MQLNHTMPEIKSCEVTQLGVTATSCKEEECSSSAAPFTEEKHSSNLINKLSLNIVVIHVCIYLLRIFGRLTRVISQYAAC